MQPVHGAVNSVTVVVVPFPGDGDRWLVLAVPGEWCSSSQNTHSEF